MKVKPGVDDSKLNKEIREALDLADKVHQIVTGKECVLTSTYDGVHRPRSGRQSRHYLNDAGDVRRWYLDAWNVTNGVTIFVALLSLILDKSLFQVCKESDHVHLEFDPK